LQKEEDEMEDEQDEQLDMVEAAEKLEFDGQESVEKLAMMNFTN